MAAALYTRTIAGTSVRASRRTLFHLLWTIFKLRLRYPRARLRIIQGTFSKGSLSAGTHDGDCVFDVEITGMPGDTAKARWWAAQRFLRAHGWAAWFRHTGTWANQNAWHIHMISYPRGLPANPTLSKVQWAFANAGQRVGEFVPGQVDDYFSHALGLKGQHRAGADTSWFPANIPRRTFIGSWWPNRYTGNSS